jgi:hypothetical protein
MGKIMMHIVMVTAVLLTGLGSAMAKDAPEPSGAELPDVPGDSIFGFTDPTDVGKPGDTAFSFENTAFAGKRMGQYLSVATKNEFSRTLDENTWAAVSLFSNYFRVRNVPDLDRNLNRIGFDGLSFEIVRRVVERSVSNPFAVSVAVEPRWARFDQGAGTRAELFAAELKLLVDAVIIPEKLYWAANVNYVAGRQRGSEPGAQWVSVAGTNVSTALAYALSPKLYIGGETRFLSAFNEAPLGKYAGSALFLGPTALWKFDEHIALNVVWTPQVWGRSQVNKDRMLDLDNAVRHLFRAKLVVQF